MGGLTLSEEEMRDGGVGGGCGEGREGELLVGIPVSCTNKAAVDGHGSTVTHSLPSAASRDFEGHDSVDADFVEEAALKHTSVLLGL